MFLGALLIGHGIGDYLLQNQWMAMNKSATTWKCLVHCLLYTAAVMLCTWPWLHGWTWAGLVFLSHFPIDRWSWADWWLKLIHGRSLTEFLHNGHNRIDAPLGPWRDNY